MSIRHNTAVDQSSVVIVLYGEALSSLARTQENLRKHWRGSRLTPWVAVYQLNDVSVLQGCSKKFGNRGVFSTEGSL